MDFDERFAAYSCGGSRSIERSLARTAFPFDPPKGNRHLETYWGVFEPSTSMRLAWNDCANLQKAVLIWQQLPPEQKI